MTLPAAQRQGLLLPVAAGHVRRRERVRRYVPRSARAGSSSLSRRGWPITPWWWTRPATTSRANSAPTCPARSGDHRPPLQRLHRRPEQHATGRREARPDHQARLRLVGLLDLRRRIPDVLVARPRRAITCSRPTRSTPTGSSAAGTPPSSCSASRDGSVRPIPETINPAHLELLGTRNDGMVTPGLSDASNDGTRTRDRVRRCSTCASARGAAASRTRERRSPPTSSGSTSARSA